ncbi:MAG: CRTAC1 family protein, partial [Candidatus Latescibacteria bacterium]|nr:CRTAC1 family protein [Candidatus Latescibacterota bacterium]
VFADVDNDSLQDLYVINRNGPNGLYQNRGRKGFVLSSSRLIFRSLTPDPRSPGSGAGGVAALFADFDHDGDLDLFLASAEDHADHLYRNRADGTFEEATAQADVGRQGMDSRAAAFGDFDDDGALDLVVADGTGRHRLYRNLRQGKMADWTARFGLRGLPPADAVAAGDYNNDGFLDLVVAGAGTPSCALSWNQNGRIFVQDSTSVILARLCARLKAQSAVPLDFDNDGFLDLVVVGTSGTAASGARLLRNLGNGRFEDASSLLPPLPPSLSAVTAGDVDHDGDLDLALVTPDGTFSVLRNEGGNTHHWLDVQLAAATMGSSKNNVYGIGSTIELNAETQYQRRVVTAPVTHFGLGSRPNADVLRVFWSNGTPQNTVSPAVNQRVVEQQRLKGSCPSLYTWDGRGYTFVTHLMTRSAIGALTDTGAPAFPDAANDYVKIQGDQLRPKDGRYTLQIVEELWDAVYLDALKLLVIDHPTASNVYVDEKYLLPPFPPFRLHTATRPRRPRAAVDEHGHDVLPLLIARDERYVGDFAPTAYQGLTEPHVITLNLGDLRGATAIRLFLNGWVMPIEPSTNLALSQREGLRAMGPALQVPDARGRWQTVIPFMGFPAGENKTIVVDLTGKFLTDDFRVRITTNLQVYWNEAFFTVDEPAVAWTITPLFPQRADLHYRGFSKEYRDSPSGPYLREYAVVDPAQQWLPFEGMRTRYGSVTPLLRASDDRYAIFSSGEEITATFDATTLPPLRPGWTRDYVLYSDGWLKEGDLNTASAATIEPLPFHGMSRYPYGPEEHDPDDEAHRAYLSTDNTRWVSAARFRDAIRRYGDVLPRLK